MQPSVWRLSPQLSAQKNPPELFTSTDKTQAGKRFISASLPSKHISAHSFLGLILVQTRIGQQGDWGRGPCWPDNHEGGIQASNKWALHHMIAS